MSNKKRIIELLNSVSDYKIGYVLAYVQGIVSDDLLCQRMVENHENNPDNQY